MRYFIGQKIIHDGGATCCIMDYDACGFRWILKAISGMHKGRFRAVTERRLENEYTAMIAKLPVPDKPLVSEDKAPDSYGFSVDDPERIDAARICNENPEASWVLVESGEIKNALLLVSRSLGRQIHRLGDKRSIILKAFCPYVFLRKEGVWDYSATESEKLPEGWLGCPLEKSEIDRMLRLFEMAMGAAKKIKVSVRSGRREGKGNDGSSCFQEGRFDVQRS